MRITSLECNQFTILWQVGQKSTHTQEQAYQHKQRNKQTTTEEKTCRFLLDPSSTLVKERCALVPAEGSLDWVALLDEIDPSKFGCVSSEFDSNDGVFADCDSGLGENYWCCARDFETTNEAVVDPVAVVAVVVAVIATVVAVDDVSAVRPLRRSDTVWRV